MRRMIQLYSDEPTTMLYFESHITIDPVSDKQEQTLQNIAKFYDFRVAKFLMKKEDGLVPDDFLTARDDLYHRIHDRMHRCIRDLERYGIAVKRYKIENTLVDSAEMF
jgi:hypothetical protein